MRRAATALVCFLASTTVGAQTQTAPIPIAVAYESPAECPTQAELERQITARSARVELGASAPAFEFHVRVEPSWRARIEVRDAAGERSVRELSGETCREVVTAAALVVAVLADPDAPGEARSAPTPAPETPKPERRAPLARPEASRPWPWKIVLGIDLSLELAPAPDPLLAPRPFVALERRPGDLLLRPALRLSGARAASGSIRTESGIAQLTWTAGRVEPCAAMGSDTGPSGQACASFELGALRGRGFETLDPNDETVLWLAPGLIARGAWGFDGVFRLELAAGADFPLRRYRFYFGPDETAHRVPAVGLTAALGIAAILP